MSKKKSKKRPGLYRLGLRVASFVALISTGILFLLIWLGFDFTAKEAINLSALIAPILFLVTYAVSYYLEYRRLETLENIFKNISRKRFMDYEGVTST
ncbi:MAG: hypothetical protein WD597_03030, partial [Balneolaceae bacterium]